MKVEQLFSCGNVGGWGGGGVHDLKKRFSHTDRLMSSPGSHLPCWKAFEHAE